MSIRVDNGSYSNNALSTTSEEVAPARPTRRQITFTNTDDTISIYIGNVDPAVNTHFLLEAGRTVVFVATTAFYGLAASGTPVLSIADEYD